MFYQQYIYVFCVDLRTNSDYFSLHYLLIGFYNRGRECSLCGTDWVFKSDGYSFILKGPITKTRNFIQNWVWNNCFGCLNQTDTFSYLKGQLLKHGILFRIGYGIIAFWVFKSDGYSFILKGLNIKTRGFIQNWAWNNCFLGV